MGKFDKYIIPLKSLASVSQTYNILLDTDYFTKIDSPEVRKGAIQATIHVKKAGGVFELTFQLEGMVVVPCDRCLDDMEQPVSCNEKLTVKLGPALSEEGDIIIIPEDEGEINIAWFLYEFIVLSIPIKHVHPPGKCNKAMSDQLRKHQSRNISESGDDEESDDLSDEDMGDDAEESEPDPRWDKLKDIYDND